MIPSFTGEPDRGGAPHARRGGFFLSAEEHDGPELVRTAVAAERAGFRTASISDHFHPWLPEQGQSPFVWSVLGEVAEATADS